MMQIVTEGITLVKNLYHLIIQLELARIYSHRSLMNLTHLDKEKVATVSHWVTHAVSYYGFQNGICFKNLCDLSCSWTRRIELIRTPVQRPGYTEGAHCHPSIPSASPICVDATNTVKHKKQSFKTSREHNSTAEKQSEPRLYHENKQPDSVICWVVRVDFNYWKI